MKNRLGIIILNYNGAEDTIECIDSLKKAECIDIADIFVLDNGSKTENIRFLRDNLSYEKTGFKEVLLDDFNDEFITNSNEKYFLIISAVNYGFAGGNNAIMEVVNSFYDYILLLNNDTVVTSDFISNMLQMFELNKNIGFGSCRINNYYDKELLWNCGGVIQPWGLRKYYNEKKLSLNNTYIRASFITGCALFIKTSVLTKYGLLTNQFFFGEEDFNFCWRMKKNGILGMCHTKPMVYHKVSKSSEKVGKKPGKLAGYYLVRIVDMKQFYRNIVWKIWKKALISVLCLHWLFMRIDIVTIKRMVQIINHFSKNELITKEDIFLVWDLKINNEGEIK